MANKKRTTCNERQLAFIEAYISCLGVKEQAGKRVGVPQQTYQPWFKLDYFVEALNEARSRWLEMLRAKGISQALNGDRTLIIFFLKSLEPETYDEGVRRQRIANEGLSDAVQQLPNILVVEADAPTLASDDEKAIGEYLQ